MPRLVSQDSLETFTKGLLKQIRRHVVFHHDPGGPFDQNREMRLDSNISGQGNRFVSPNHLIIDQEKLSFPMSGNSPELHIKSLIVLLD